MKTLISIVLALLIVAGGAFTFHYFTSGAGAHAASGAANQLAKPPTPVVVQTMEEKKVRIWTEYSGRMHAVDYAEIRPEVSGRIMEVRFQDGQMVKQGDVLFVIEPAPFEAAVERDRATLESAQSKLVRAQLDQTRGNQLIKDHAIAQNDLDNYNNTVRVAQADVDNAQAQLKQAQIDLDHAYVTAPISGRASRAEITVGNVVQAGISAPLLTSIVSQDGIYADFEVDEQTYLDTIRNSASGNAEEQLIPVQLVAAGDTSHVYTGFMQSFDNRIDPSSGTIRARAKFANSDGTLVPGMFVTVKLASSRDDVALLVADRAVSFDQNKKFVYVVGDDNKVAYREIELGKVVGRERVVESGLKPGDRVIVDGVQQVRPNDTVAPTEMTADAQGAPDTEQVANTNRG
jgi:multidrug efflux system membrane fusion protein